MADLAAQALPGEAALGVDDGDAHLGVLDPVQAPVGQAATQGMSGHV